MVPIQGFEREMDSCQKRVQVLTRLLEDADPALAKSPEVMQVVSFIKRTASRPMSSTAAYLDPFDKLSYADIAAGRVSPCTFLDTATEPSTQVALTKPVVTLSTENKFTLEDDKMIVEPVINNITVKTVECSPKETIVIQTNDNLAVENIQRRGRSPNRRGATKETQQGDKRVLRTGSSNYKTMQTVPKEEFECRSTDHAKSVAKRLLAPESSRGRSPSPMFIPGTTASYAEMVRGGSRPQSRTATPDRTKNQRLMSSKPFENEFASTENKIVQDRDTRDESNPFNYEPNQTINKQDDDVKGTEKENQLKDSKTPLIENTTQKLPDRLNKHTAEQDVPPKKGNNKTDIQDSTSVAEDKSERILANKDPNTKPHTKTKPDKKKSSKQSSAEPAVPSALNVQPDIQVNEYEAGLSSELQYSAPYTDNQVGLQYSPGMFQPYIGPEGEVASFIASGQQLISSGLGTYTTPQAYCEQPLFVGDTFRVDNSVYHIQQTAEYQPQVFVSDPQSYITSFGGSHTAYTHIQSTPLVHGTDNETSVSYASILAQGLTAGPHMNQSRLQMQTEAQPWSNLPACDTSAVTGSAEKGLNIQKDDVSMKGMKHSKNPLLRNERNVAELENPIVSKQEENTEEDFEPKNICQKDFSNEKLEGGICSTNDSECFDAFKLKKNKKKEKHSPGTKIQNVNSSIPKSATEQVSNTEDIVLKQTKKNKNKEVKSSDVKPPLLKETSFEKDQSLNITKLKSQIKSEDEEDKKVINNDSVNLQNLQTDIKHQDGFQVSKKSKKKNKTSQHDLTPNVEHSKFETKSLNINTGQHDGSSNVLKKPNSSSNQEKGPESSQVETNIDSGSLNSTVPEKSSVENVASKSKKKSKKTHINETNKHGAPSKETKKTRDQTNESNTLSVSNEIKITVTSSDMKKQPKIDQKVDVTKPNEDIEHSKFENNASLVDSLKLNQASSSKKKGKKVVENNAKIISVEKTHPNKELPVSEEVKVKPTSVQMVNVQGNVDPLNKKKKKKTDLSCQPNNQSKQNLEHFNEELHIETSKNDHNEDSKIKKKKSKQANKNQGVDVNNTVDKVGIVKSQDLLIDVMSASNSGNIDENSPPQDVTFLSEGTSDNGAQSKKKLKKHKKKLTKETPPNEATSDSCNLVNIVSKINNECSLVKEDVSVDITDKGSGHVEESIASHKTNEGEDTIKNKKSKTYKKSLPMQSEEVINKKGDHAANEKQVSPIQSVPDKTATLPDTTEVNLQPKKIKDKRKTNRKENEVDSKKAIDSKSIKDPEIIESQSKVAMKEESLISKQSSPLGNDAAITTESKDCDIIRTEKKRKQKQTKLVKLSEKSKTSDMDMSQKSLVSQDDESSNINVHIDEQIISNDKTNQSEDIECNKSTLGIVVDVVEGPVFLTSTKIDVGEQPIEDNISIFSGIKTQKEIENVNLVVTTEPSSTLDNKTTSSDVHEKEFTCPESIKTAKDVVMNKNEVQEKSTMIKEENHLQADDLSLFKHLSGVHDQDEGQSFSNIMVDIINKLDEAILKADSDSKSASPRTRPESSDNRESETIKAQISSPQTNIKAIPDGFKTEITVELGNNERTELLSDKDPDFKEDKAPEDIQAKHFSRKITAKDKHPHQSERQSSSNKITNTCNLPKTDTSNNVNFNSREINNQYKNSKMSSYSLESKQDDNQLTDQVNVTPTAQQLHEIESFNITKLPADSLDDETTKSLDDNHAEIFNKDPELIGTVQNSPVKLETTNFEQFTNIPQISTEDINRKPLKLEKENSADNNVSISVDKLKPDDNQSQNSVVLQDIPVFISTECKLSENTPNTDIAIVAESTKQNKNITSSSKKSKPSKTVNNVKKGKTPEIEKEDYFKKSEGKKSSDGEDNLTELDTSAKGETGNSCKSLNLLDQSNILSKHPTSAMSTDEEKQHSIVSKGQASKKAKNKKHLVQESFICSEGSSESKVTKMQIDEKCQIAETLTRNGENKKAEDNTDSNEGGNEEISALSKHITIDRHNNAKDEQMHKIPDPLIEISIDSEPLFVSPTDKVAKSNKITILRDPIEDKMVEQPTSVNLQYKHPNSKSEDLQSIIKEDEKGELQKVQTLTSMPDCCVIQKEKGNDIKPLQEIMTKSKSKKLNKKDKLYSEETKSDIKHKDIGNGSKHSKSVPKKENKSKVSELSDSIQQISNISEFSQINIKTHDPDTKHSDSETITTKQNLSKCDQLIQDKKKKTRGKLNKTHLSTPNNKISDSKDNTKAHEVPTSSHSENDSKQEAKTLLPLLANREKSPLLALAPPWMAKLVQGDTNYCPEVRSTTTTIDVLQPNNEEQLATDAFEVGIFGSVKERSRNPTITEESAEMTHTSIKKQNKKDKSGQSVNNLKKSSQSTEKCQEIETICTTELPVSSMTNLPLSTNKISLPLTLSEDNAIIALKADKLLSEGSGGISEESIQNQNKPFNNQEQENIKKVLPRQNKKNKKEKLYENTSESSSLSFHIPEENKTKSDVLAIKDSYSLVKLEEGSNKPPANSRVDYVIESTTDFNENKSQGNKEQSKNPGDDIMIIKRNSITLEETETESQNNVDSDLTLQNIEFKASITENKQKDDLKDTVLLGKCSSEIIIIDQDQSQNSVKTESCINPSYSDIPDNLKGNAGFVEEENSSAIVQPNLVKEHSDLLNQKGIKDETKDNTNKSASDVLEDANEKQKMTDKITIFECNENKTSLTESDSKFTVESIEPINEIILEDSETLGNATANPHSVMELKVLSENVLQLNTIDTTSEKDIKASISIRPGEDLPEYELMKREIQKGNLSDGEGREYEFGEINKTDIATVIPDTTVTDYQVTVIPEKPTTNVKIGSSIYLAESETTPEIVKKDEYEATALILDQVSLNQEDSCIKSKSQNSHEIVSSNNHDKIINVSNLEKYPFCDLPKYSIYEIERAELNWNVLHILNNSSSLDEGFGISKNNSNEFCNGNTSSISNEPILKEENCNLNKSWAAVAATDRIVLETNEDKKHDIVDETTKSKLLPVVICVDTDDTEPPKTESLVCIDAEGFMEFLPKKEIRKRRSRSKSRTREENILNIDSISVPDSSTDASGCNMMKGEMTTVIKDVPLTTNVTNSDKEMLETVDTLKQQTTDAKIPSKKEKLSIIKSMPKENGHQLLSIKNKQRSRSRSRSRNISETEKEVNDILREWSREDILQLNIPSDKTFWPDKWKYDDAEKTFYESLSINKTKTSIQISNNFENDDNGDDKGPSSGPSSPGAGPTEGTGDNSGKLDTTMKLLTANLPHGIGAWSDASTYLSEVNSPSWPTEESSSAKQLVIITSQFTKLTKVRQFDSYF